MCSQISQARVTFLFTVTSAEEAREGDARSIVSVYVTPYQMGINWSTWMLTEGEELFGYTRLISYRKLTMTQPQGALHCFDWDPLFWESAVTDHRNLEHTWFDVSSGRDPRLNTDARWLKM